MCVFVVMKQVYLLVDIWYHWVPLTVLQASFMLIGAHWGWGWWLIVASDQSNRMSLCKETTSIPSNSFPLVCRLHTCVYVHTLLSPATNALDRYLNSICSWFTKKERQGLSVPLWYAQIRALGLLFKHLRPGVLERPPSPLPQKRRKWKSERCLLLLRGVYVKSNEHKCVRVRRLMRGWLFPPLPASAPNTAINNKNNRSENRADKKEFIDLSHSFIAPVPLQK